MKLNLTLHPAREVGMEIFHAMISAYLVEHI